MKTRKRTIGESAGDVDLFIRTHSMKQMGRHKEFDRRFARQLSDALEQFALRKKMTPEEVMDGGDNLMSEFANWAKKKLGLNIDQYMPSAEEFVESFDGPADEYEMADFIARCLRREGTIYVDEHGDEADFFFDYNGISYRVKVEEVEEYTSRDSHDEPLPWKPKRR